MTQHRYRPELRAWLKDELSRLEQGPRLEKQKFNNAMSAIAKVLADPLTPEFRKILPENYKAADVLQQVRIFFKVVDDPRSPTSNEKVAYFVWINSDDDIKHRSGKSDDCYEVFRKMVECGEIEPYNQPDEAVPSFKISGTWGSSAIYVEFKMVSNQTTERAVSHLNLSETTPNEYKIGSVSVTSLNSGLTTGLFGNLCPIVDQKKVTLTYELWITAETSAKQRHILNKFYFSLTDTIDDFELWVRPPQI